MWGFLLLNSQPTLVVIFNMEKSRSKPNVRDEIHQIFGINGILSVLKSDKYQIQEIDILESSSVTSNVETKELLKNYTSHTHYINRDTFYRK